MQIVANTTGMPADLCVQIDKHGRDHCVVVVKGTFVTDARGQLRLAAKQRPLVYTDEHYGDPAGTCVRNEGEFALSKPLTDVLVVGQAVAPGGRPVAELPVRLEVMGHAKDLLVIGERQWVRSLGGLTASPPVPFRTMPLTFDRAFGGMDDARGPDQVAVERRNLSGVGFHAHRSARQIEGTPLPNLEQVRDRITRPHDRPSPIGLGCIGRGWIPRVEFAGTYDARWRDYDAPFLPRDFDDHYFQSAPLDQQHPRFRGGERVRCVHMAEQPVVEYTIPIVQVPIRFRFDASEQLRIGELDTVILEPHLHEVMLVWRASVPMTKRLVELRAVVIGEVPKGRADGMLGYRRGKPLFRDLEATIRWLRRQRGPRP